MTTNETMRDLLEMIGGAEWEEPKLSFVYKLKCNDMGKLGHAWVVTWEDTEYGFSDVAGKSDHEAQALIEKAAIEWLSTHVTTLTIEALRAKQWRVRWWECPRHFDGPTLLEALYAAVKAVKESKDAAGK